MTHNHFIKKNKNKNGIRCIIYIFKNYFVIIFLIFNKISCIQTEISKPPKKKKKTKERDKHYVPSSLFSSFFFLFLVKNYFFNAEEKLSCACLMRPIYDRHVNFTCV